ncbi:MAG: spermidine/putrescine ABC transporter substrate-binding protein [Actinomycetota bacterium]
MRTARDTRTLVVAVLMLAVAAVIAACGSEETIGGGNKGEVQVAKAGKPTGDVTISNWPGYIDPGKNGTVAEFEHKFDVNVSHIEDINDNVQFFGKLQPQLERGQSGGRSLFVVTDWMAKQMYDLGYLQELNHGDLRTVFDSILPELEKSDSDPQRKFSIPWQGGLTGIWVDTKRAPEIRSVEDLFDSKYKGKVTMLTEMRDTVPLVLQSQGVDVAEATKEEWLAAIDRLKEAADSGQIRRFTGNEYTEDLTSGNVVAAIGWSGDASLIGREGIEWRKPADGCDLFFDQMVIPVGAPNTAAALAFMNFVYRPEVQADIAEYVNYVTPVEGVQEILTQRDPELGRNQLIFPPPELTRGCSGDPDPPGSAQDQQEVTEAFQDVITG